MTRSSPTSSQRQRTPAGTGGRLSYSSLSLPRRLAPSLPRQTLAMRSIGERLLPAVLGLERQELLVDSAERRP
jgi:hypothetical protein